MADASTSSDFAKIPSWQCSDMLAIADIGFFANMAYTRVQRKILEIRLSEVSKKCRYCYECQAPCNAGSNFFPDFKTPKAT